MYDASGIRFHAGRQAAVSVNMLHLYDNCSYVPLQNPKIFQTPGGTSHMSKSRKLYLHPSIASALKDNQINT